jgi:hypothetical protein
VLKVTADESSACDVVRVHSALLEELDINVCKNTTCQGIDIVTPMLKQLSLTDHDNADLSVSISAPMMGKVSWICSYEGLDLVFGMVTLKIETVEVNKDNEWVEVNKDNEWVLSNEREDAFAPLPHIDVLSLHLYDLVRLLSVYIFNRHNLQAKLILKKF